MGNDRKINLKDALKAVDEWLNSEDTWVTDKEGNRIKGGLIACKPSTMTMKFVEKMNPKKKVYRKHKNCKWY